MEHHNHPPRQDHSHRLSPLAALLIAALRLYRQFLSPLLPPACRFTPSCSEYAMDSLRVHGLVRGGWLALCRLLRCHPGHEGGWDPVRAGGAENEKGKRLHGSQDITRLRSTDDCRHPLSAVGTQARATISAGGGQLHQRSWSAG